MALTDTGASSSSTMKHVRSCRSDLTMAMTIPNETRYRTMGPQLGVFSNTLGQDPFSLICLLALRFLAGTLLGLV